MGGGGEGQGWDEGEEGTVWTSKKVTDTLGK